MLRSHVPCIVCVSLCLSVAAAGTAELSAQTRRALLIGINDVCSARRCCFTGRGNRARLGQPFRCRLILAQVSRDLRSTSQVCRCCCGIRSNSLTFACFRRHWQPAREYWLQSTNWLRIQKPGDRIVFYYSGHGSQRLDTLSSKNHLDETIVPIDAWKGAKDIRDKELAIRFG